jgi:hypothetical protein
MVFETGSSMYLFKNGGVELEGNSGQNPRKVLLSG